MFPFHGVLQGMVPGLFLIVIYIKIVDENVLEWLICLRVKPQLLYSWQS